MVELLDISISNKKIDRRKYKKKGIKANLFWTSKDPEELNAFAIALNHRKHEGMIYRKAVGEFETKGKPRFHTDFYE